MRQIFKSLTALIVLLIGLLSTFKVYSRNLPPVSSTIDYEPTLGQYLSVQDPYYSKYTSSWFNSFSNLNVKNRVVFSIDRSQEHRHIQHSGDIVINFTVIYDKYTNNTVGLIRDSFTKEVTLHYDTGYLAKETDQVTELVQNAVWSSVRVNSVLYSLGVSYPAPAGHPRIGLENILDIERVDRMNNNYVINPVQVDTSRWETINTAKYRAKFIHFSWGALPQWVEAVELEYIFINYSTNGNISGTGSYGFIQSQISPSNCPINFRNDATRIFLEGQPGSFEIPNLFPDGYIVFRVRPVGKNFKNPDEWIQGLWTMNDQVTLDLPSEVAALRAFNTISISKLVHPSYTSMNSHAGFIFAEEGKVASVITYFDGTLRERQSIAYSRATQTFSVASKVYDYLGREAISTLPAVAMDDFGYEFRKKFLVSAKSGNAYNYTDFDLNKSGTQDISVSSMAITSGPSKYYSSNLPTWIGNLNTLSDVEKQMHNFVPDAQGYPFIQTEFTNDPSGRTTRTGGLGMQLQLSAYDQNNIQRGGHEVSTWDGTPFQAELDVLFGNEVGYAQKYKKVMSRDQNGQISIAYLDPYGRTIATSLAGTPDTSKLDALTSSAHSLKYSVILPNTYENQSEGKKIITHHFLVTAKDTWRFSYNLEVPSFNVPCDTNLCFTCGYSLTLSLKDRNENELFPSGTPLGQFIGNPLPSKGACLQTQKFSIDPDPIAIVLEPGEYVLTKILEVDQTLRQQYKKMWMDSVKCLKTFDQFLAEEKQKMGLDCNMGCEECKEEKLRLFEVIDSIANYCLTHEIDTGTYDPYWAAKQEYNQINGICSDVCMEKTPCDVLLDAMLQDLSPGGQFAKYVIPGWDGNDSLVALEGSNILPGTTVFQSAGSGWCSSAWSGSVPFNTSISVWRQPFNYGKSISLRNVYLDENGKEALIEVVNGVPSASEYLTIDGKTYARPHQLLNYNDFIFYFQSSWANSLLYFHPEYCLYSKCRKINESYVYDNLLLNTYDAAEAIKKGFYNPLGMSYTSSDTLNLYGNIKTINYSSYEQSSPLRDPILSYSFLNTTGLVSKLKQIPLNCTTSVTKSFWQLYERERANYGLNVLDTCVDNIFWPLLRAHYLQQKREWLTSYYNDSCPNGNSCGNSTTSIGVKRFLINSISDLVWNDNDNPEIAEKERWKNENGCDPSQVNNKISEQVASFCQNKCAGNVEAWMLKLENCPSIQALNQTQIDNLKADLQKLCESGCDLDNPYGSVTRNPNADIVIYPEANLKDVLKKHLGDNWFVKGICDDLLIDFPGEYGHDYLATSDPYADTCACNPKKEIPGSKRCPETGVDSLAKEDCACDKLPALKYEALTTMEIANEFKCKSCISCDDLQEPVRSFLETYKPEFEADSFLYQKLLTTWLNRKFKFNLTYYEYQNYAFKCLDTITYTSWVSPWLQIGINRTISFNGFNIYDLPVFSDSMIRKLIPEEEYDPGAIGVFYDPFASKPTYSKTLALGDNSNYSPFINNSTASSDAEEIACECEKIMKVYGLLQGPPPSSNSATQIYTQFFGTPPTCLNPIQDLKNFCSNLWNLQPATTAPSNPIGYTEGDKFDENQKNHIESQIPSISPGILSCLLDGGCTSMEDNQARDYMDTCACNLLKQLKNQWLAAGAFIGTGMSYKEYIYQQKGDNPDNPDELLDLCDQYIKSDFDKDQDGITPSWTLGSNFWSPVSNENLKKFAKNKNLMVPDSFTCEPSPKDTVRPPGPSCIKLRDCNTMKELIHQYLQDNPLPSGQESFSDYQNDGCGPDDPSLSAYDLLRNVHAMEDKIKEMEHDNFLFNQRMLIIGAGGTTGNPPYDQQDIDDLRDWKDAFKQWFYDLHTDCDPMPSHIDFDYLLQFYSYCKPGCFPPSLASNPKCGTCYTVDTNWLRAFVKYNNQILTARNSADLSRIVDSRWPLYSSSTGYSGYIIPEFYNSLIYESRTYKDYLKYKIAEFNYPYIRIQIPDNNGYLLEYSMEFLANHDWINFGNITKFKNPRGIRMQGCEPLQYFYVDVEQTIDKKYWDNSTLLPGEIKCADCPTEIVNGVPVGCKLTYTLLVRVNTKSIQKNVQCLSCAKLCNKPLVRPVIQYRNECLESELQTATSNALLSYNAYLLAKAKEFDSTYITNCFLANDTMGLKFSNKQYHYTLYYFDRAGNLCKTVPPEGVDIDNTTLSASHRQLLADTRIHMAESHRKNNTQPKAITYHTLICNYKYNSISLIDASYSPDKGLNRFWYDNLGRKIITQNLVQKNENKFSYVIYDEISRAIESGEINPSVSDFNLSYEQAANSLYISSFLDVSSNAYLKKHVITRSYSVPLNLMRLGSVFDLGGQLNLRNRIATISYEIINDNNSSTYDHATYYSYDVRGNVKTLVQDIVGLDQFEYNLFSIHYNYDILTSKINRVDYQKGKLDQLTHKYQYDDNIRLKNTLTSRDKVNWENDVSYYYYLNGTLGRKELGQILVQGVDYTHTLSGWIKGINSGTINSYHDMGRDGDLGTYPISGVSSNPNQFVARDAYGYYLKYFNDDYLSVSGQKAVPDTYTVSFSNIYRQLFNGNISHMGTALPNLNAYWSGSPSHSTLGNVYHYDQLNRITKHHVYSHLDYTNNIWPATSTAGNNQYYENFKYDANGNILNLNRNGNLNGSNLKMDGLSYHYLTEQKSVTIGSTVITWTALVNNRLYHVNDVVANSIYSNDVDDMGTYNSSNVTTGNNFQFDDIGNLSSDFTEEIDEITWTVSGKIESIKRISTSIKPDLEYGYYADGQRLYKLVKPKESNGNLKQELYWVYTYYIRDAQGNIMATYNKAMSPTENENTYNENLEVADWSIYGSERLGIIKEENVLLSQREFTMFGSPSNGSWSDRTYTGAASLTNVEQNTFYMVRGNKQYELSNHLGNVLVTVQDRKRSMDINSNNLADYYVPYLRTVTDYYAFGSSMPGIGGVVPKCTVTQTQTTQTVVDVNEDFNSGGTGGFTAGTGARTVSNPSGTKLHIESLWSTRPLANRTVSLVNGRSYTLDFDLDGFSVVSGYTHTVRVRILLPGSTQTFSYTTTGSKSLTFTSNTTGNVTIEISSLITGSGSYSLNPYIDIDNFELSWEDQVTISVNNCNSVANYKFGFNNQEKDINDLDYYSFNVRIYDSRIGKFLSVDPLEKDYPWNSPYAFAENDVIRAIDLEGMERYVVTISPYRSGNTILTLVSIQVDYSQSYQLALNYTDINGNILSSTSDLAILFFIRNDVRNFAKYLGDHKINENNVNGVFVYSVDGFDGHDINEFSYTKPYEPIRFIRNGVMTTTTYTPRMPPPPPPRIVNAPFNLDLNTFVNPAAAQNQINAAIAALPAGTTNVNITISTTMLGPLSPHVNFGTAVGLLNARAATIRGMLPAGIIPTFNFVYNQLGPTFSMTTPVANAPVPMWTITTQNISEQWQLNADGTFSRVGPTTPVGAPATVITPVATPVGVGTIYNTPLPAPPPPPPAAAATP